MSKFFESKWKYFVIILSVALVAGIGTLFVNLGLDWFQTLKTPSVFVPAVLISVVWSIIYLTFSVVLCLWLRKETLRTSTIVLLIVNGVLNVLWCLLFFALNNTFLGVVSIVAILIASYLLLINIFKQKPIYAYVLAIYPAWVSIATTLNLALWILN